MVYLNLPGETAASTNPSMNPQSQGRSSKKCDAIATVVASTRHGINASLKTIPRRQIGRGYGTVS